MTDVTTQPDQNLTRDKRRAELAALTFKPNGQMFQPQTGKELMDMANLMSTAGFMVKDIYRDHPGACMGLISICSPYGLNPLQVSWKTYKASKSDDAPIAFEAQVVTAMLNASGIVKGRLRYAYEGEGVGRVCIASGTLVGSVDPVEVRSPLLGNITPKNSPLWKSDPDQQLAYYTGRSWARRYAAEMLLGVYDVDEMQDIPGMRNITPTESQSGFARLGQDAREKAKAAPDQTADVQTDAHDADQGHVDAPEPEFEADPALFNAGYDAGMDVTLTRENLPTDLTEHEQASWLSGFDRATSADGDE